MLFFSLENFIKGPNGRCGAAVDYRKEPVLPEAYLVSRAGFSVIGQRIFKAESSHRQQLWFLHKRKSFLWSPQMLSGQIGSGLCQECVPF